MALALGSVVAWFTACSGVSGLPTLVPTRVMPTSDRVAVIGVPTVTPVATIPSSQPAQIMAYDYDPATGQMVPTDRLSGVTAGESDKLWVVTEDAFVEYRRRDRAKVSTRASEKLDAYKVISYTYDDIGRRVGWTVTWPQGPTPTQRLVFLYEGLVAVGERLEVNNAVTTTYYSWATRDRNTTEDNLALKADAPISDVTRYDSRCQAAAGIDCVTMIARILVSEASVGNEQEQRAVAWTFRNRLDRGLALLSYAMDGTPNRQSYFDLAHEVLTAPVEADVTKGATHFFSPRSMPLQGQESRCKPRGIYDCDGGLVYVEGLDAPAYAPFWHLLYEWLPVAGIRKTHFLFYRIPPIRPRIGQ